MTIRSTMAGFRASSRFEHRLANLNLTAEAAEPSPRTDTDLDAASGRLADR